MISLNNEDIPLKKDETTEITTTTTELTMENPIEMTIQETCNTKENGTNTSLINGDCCNNNNNNNNTTTTSTVNRLFNAQFQQKTKYLREMWAQHKVKIDKDHTQLLLICAITTVGIMCSIGSLLTNFWIGDSHTHTNFGIWNTCWQEKYETNQTWPVGNDTTTKLLTAPSLTVEGMRWMCARQGIYDVTISQAEKWRVDQMFASQGLLVSGAVVYVFSVVMLWLSYRFIGLNRLNVVRNTLVISMFTQMIAFLMQLIGYFLFIFTDRASVSIALLFVYFGLTIFATNIINFITIEYKAFKIRQMTI